MPYGTMIYPNNSFNEIFPTIYTELGLSSQLLLDQGSKTVDCVEGSSFEVHNDVEMLLDNGATWLAFVSVPVSVQCTGNTAGPFALQIVNTLQPLGDSPLTVRLAGVVINSSTTSGLDDYKQLLRSNANVYPGSSTSMRFEVNGTEAAMVFDWDPQFLNGGDNSTAELLTFAMPHHQDKLTGVMKNFCSDVLLGSVCLVEGSNWVIVEDLPEVSFQAPRKPDLSMLSDLAEAASNDLSYQIPANFLIGASDTYFSGKAMAKLGRILLIAEEVMNICGQRRLSNLRSLQPSNITDACVQNKIPTQSAIDEALLQLQQAVDVWIDGEAEAPLLFDTAWGGVVSCGCDYSNGHCQNIFPNCPGLTDQLINFGNGFYNDHHFHYGYHIYAAATLAHFNHTWGRNNYEKVLMLVRDIANPSVDDSHFPTVRHMDWFHGSSWASGIPLPVSPTGMNQESSSEAIAAYEAVALFGKTMSLIFSEDADKVNLASADTAYQMGKLLLATELRSAKRYWHVYQSNNTSNIFDSSYQHDVVGILWSSKAFFGTWFGTSPYLIYGIQLIPLTPISEDRDNMAWVRKMFDPYAQTCDSSCVSQGWSVQILALLASLGYKEKALGYAKNLTASVFETAGGNGHSMSNTIWYIATRPDPSEEYSLVQTYAWEAGPFQVTCSQPTTCTQTVLGSMAGQYTCEARISYLINQEGETEHNACYQVAVTEFPDVCGPCNPDGGSSSANSTAIAVPGGNGTVVSETQAPSNSVNNTGTAVPIGNDTIVSQTQAAALPSFQDLTCNQPSTCTAAVLGAAAATFTCEARIKWLMTAKGLSEVAACTEIAVNQFPSACGGCNPQGN